MAETTGRQGEPAPDVWLQELVRLRTVSGDVDAQREAIQRVLSVFRDLELPVVVTEDMSAPHPWALVDVAGRADVSRLVFACHVDTVPVGSLRDWEFDPWGAEIEDGVLRGRGSADMKAGLVAATLAVISAVSTGHAVSLLLTSDEEIGSRGAGCAGGAVGALDVGAVIIPEATGNGIHLGHRGALWLEVSTTGTSAHGSTPQLGVNAVLEAVTLLDRARSDLPLGRDPFLRDETWNVGLIQGGTVVNIVPDTTRMLLDHRIVDDGEHLTRWWTSQPEVEGVETILHLDPVRTPASDGWLQSLAWPASPEPVTYFTDGSALRPVVGSAPIVIWGPGRPSSMHVANESVDLSDLDEAITRFTAVARAWPRVENPPSTASAPSGATKP